MAQVQMLKLFNLEESPTVKAPGDLRLWEALEKVTSSIEFNHFRVLVVEWPDEVDISEFHLSKWSELLGMNGLWSISLCSDFSLPSLQRRRLGCRSNDLEILLAEILNLEGYPAPIEIWEADQFEMSASSGSEKIMENVTQLLKLGVRTGLFDPEHEEIRLVGVGDSLIWPRKIKHDDEDNAGSLDNLLEKWKFTQAVDFAPDPIHRAYQIKEQHVRGTVALRNEKSLNEQISELQNVRLSADVEKLKKELFHSAPLAFDMSLFRYADIETTVRETRNTISQHGVLSDSSFGVFRWSEKSASRILPTCDLNVPSMPMLITPSGEFRLWALQPISQFVNLPWRRLESLLSLTKDWLQEDFKVVSGHESWTKFFKRHISAHKGWQISDNSISTLWKWERARVPAEKLLLFFSDWSSEKVHDLLKVYGLSAIDLGNVLDDVDVLRVTREGQVFRDVSWIDVFSGEELSAADVKMQTMVWNAPDLKSPTYGFEKIAVFPDQFLLKILNYGSLGDVERRVRWHFQSDAQSREIAMKHPSNRPAYAHKWISNSQRVAVDAFASSSNVSEVSPYEASRWSVDIALRGLVARGVDPSSPIFMKAQVPKPRYTQNSDKDSASNASFILCVESLLEITKRISNLNIVNIDLDSMVLDGGEYCPEPMIHLRGEVSKGFSSAFSGFRMSGEVLYAVGPRPAFMDIGSRVLKHVRVVSNHASQISWDEQLEMYKVIHECLISQVITGIRPIGWGGIVEELAEMSLWSGIGVQLKPALSTFELFSGAPGRFVVGVLPQEAKRFEGLVKSEWLTPLGTSSGEKLFGLPIEKYRESRLGIKS